MHNNRHTILAINPGTRYLGIAIFRGSVLIDWSVKVVNGRQPSAKLDCAKSLVFQIIDEYQPDELVLKRLHSSRSSKNLDRLSYEIEDEVLYEAKDLHSHWFEFGKEEKRRIIENITNKVIVGTDEVTIDLCHLPQSPELMAKRQQTAGVRCLFAIWFCKRANLFVPHIRMK